MQSTKFNTALLPGKPQISAFLRLNMKSPNTKNAAMRAAQRMYGVREGAAHFLRPLWS